MISLRYRTNVVPSNHISYLLRYPHTCTNVVPTVEASPVAYGGYSTSTLTGQAQPSLAWYRSHHPGQGLVATTSIDLARGIAILIGARGSGLIPTHPKSYYNDLRESNELKWYLAPQTTSHYIITLIISFSLMATNHAESTYNL